MYYPASIEENKAGQYEVHFRDVPQAFAVGKDIAQAIDLAQSALLKRLEIYYKFGQLTPFPSLRLPGELLIQVPITSAIKLVLLDEMVKQKVTKYKLAQRMGVTTDHVYKFCQLDNQCKIETLEKALACLGKELRFNVVRKKR